MIAAIYARKSTEQHGVSEEEKSITRQIEHGRAYAERKGWTPAPAHVYSDDGISGAEFVKRPGLTALLNALTPRPPFDVLVMSEESRLGRESIETGYVLKQITDAGVRVFFYLEDRERTLDSAMDKVMLHLTNFASEMEREKARQRTYDAMVRKAKALHVTGGVVYGYDNVDICSPEGRRLHVVRRVNAIEAAVVRRLFEASAGGAGLTRMAKMLNREGIAPPGGHTRGWAPTAIREMLHRELYAGVVVWNRTQKISRGGTKKQRRRPESEWLRLEAPELRIIGAELWGLVRARLATTRTTYARTRDGALLGRPSAGDVESKYLLSGLASCSICGGSLVSIPRQHQGQAVPFYGCVYHHKRGAAICSNDVRVRQEILERAFLHALHDVLDARLLAAAVDRALDLLRSGRERTLDRRTQIERELSLIEAKQRRVLDVFANGEHDDVAMVRITLRAEEERKQALGRELAGLAGEVKLADLDATRMKRDLTTLAEDVKALVTPTTTTVARQMLRKLFPDRIVCAPFDEHGQRGYRFTATGTYGRLLSGTAVNDGGGPNGPRGALTRAFTFTIEGIALAA